MEAILSEIERTSREGFHFAAVALALTLPDICAALASDNGESSGQKYKAWCEANFLHLYPNLTSRDLWSLRCGVVHQGRFGHPKSQYSRVIFSLPDGRGNVFHNNILNDALNLDAATFCRDMVSSARQWFLRNQNNVEVAKNLPYLLQYRASGLPPYMAGMPVIA